MFDWLFCNEVGKLPNIIAESKMDGVPKRIRFLSRIACFLQGSSGSWMQVALAALSHDHPCFTMRAPRECAADGVTIKPDRFSSQHATAQGWIWARQASPTPSKILNISSSELKEPSCMRRVTLSLILLLISIAIPRRGLKHRRLCRCQNLSQAAHKT